MTGFFISIEGIHGCGKTTLMKRLVQELNRRKFKVRGLTDLGATLLGKEIRKAWVNNPNIPSDYPIDYLSEAFLILASRRQNVLEIIKPGLEQGYVVISARFNDALLAFQGYACGGSFEILQFLADATAEGVVPDYTILLDILPEESMSRIPEEERHLIESRPIDFHRDLREGYLKIARQNPERIKVYDATLDPESIFQAVLGDILPRLSDRQHN